MRAWNADGLSTSDVESGVSLLSVKCGCESTSPFDTERMTDGEWIRL